MKNITLQGIGGQLVIKAQDPMQLTHLFEWSELSKMRFITLRVKNIVFRGIGIARLISMTPDNNIIFQGCHFENTVTSRDTILIESRHNNVQTNLVHFHNCRFLKMLDLEVSRAISINHTRSIFHKCFFKNNWLTGKGLIRLAGKVTIFEDSCFEQNTPVSKYISRTTGGMVYAIDNSSVEV